MCVFKGGDCGDESAEGTMMSTDSPERDLESLVGQRHC